MTDPQTQAAIEHAEKNTDLHLSVLSRMVGIGIEPSDFRRLIAAKSLYDLKGGNVTLADGCAIENAFIESENEEE